MSDLRVYFRLSKMAGLSMDKIQGATDIYYTLNFQKSEWEMSSEHERQQLPDFSDEILACDVQADKYKKEILYITLLATIKNKECAIAVLNVPLRICPLNGRVHGKFLFTTSRYPGRIKGSIDLHVSIDKHVKPFAVEKQKINMAVLEPFMSSHGPRPPSSSGRMQGNGSMPRSTPGVSRRGIPPEERLTPQQMQGIWTAINMAPPEVWPYFQNKTFLMDCLTYYRVPGAPKEAE